MNKAKDIAGRIVALFLTNALGVVTGAAVIAPDLEVWKSALIAKASIDGVLTKDEIDAAFGASPKKIAAKKVSKAVTK